MTPSHLVDYMITPLHGTRGNAGNKVISPEGELNVVKDCV
jgi:hypothetical protein